MNVDRKKIFSVAIAVSAVMVFALWPKSYQQCIENAASKAQGSNAAFHELRAICQQPDKSIFVGIYEFLWSKKEASPRLVEFNGTLDGQK